MAFPVFRGFFGYKESHIALPGYYHPPFEMLGRFDALPGRKIAQVTTTHLMSELVQALAAAEAC
jgi:hypothetical protein